jgi:hypothetical protein
MRRADAEGMPTPAAETSAAASGSRRRAPLQQDDVDELRAQRVLAQQRVNGVASGMARAAAAASLSAEEVEERRKRRREQKNKSDRKRRAIQRAAEDAEESEGEGAGEGEGESEGEGEGESEGEGEGESEGDSEGEGESESDGEHVWQSPSKELRAELRAQWRGEDDTAEHERREAERRADAWSGQPDDERGVFCLPFAELKRRVEEGLLTRPGDDQAAYDLRVYRDRVARGVSVGEYLNGFYGPGGPDEPPPPPPLAAAAVLCPHGEPMTDDWLLDEGQPAANWSSRCDVCLAHRLAVRACDAACAAVGLPARPESPPLPDGLHAAGEESVLPMPQLCGLLRQLSRQQLQERLDRLDACIAAEEAAAAAAYDRSVEKAQIGKLLAQHRQLPQGTPYSAAVMEAQAAGRRRQVELRAKASSLAGERYEVRQQQLKCPNCGSFSCGQVAGWACSQPQPSRNLATTWRAPDGTRHGKLPAAEDPRRRRTAEEPEPDWAPYATVDGKVLGKSSDFYYNFDGAAATSTTLMTHSVSADPSALYRWLEDPPAGQPPVPPPPSLPPPPTEDGPVVDGPPPRRSMYRRGRKGRRIFHRERADWYERATGRKLEGTLAEQHECFNAVTRRYRAYSDR